MKPYYIPTSDYKRWKKGLSEKGILFLYEKVGSGKTTQACYFAEKHYKSHLYLSGKEEDVLAQAEIYLTSPKSPEEEPLLLLDDVHLLRGEDEKKKLFALLTSQNHKASFIPVFLLSQGALPPYLTPLRMSDLLQVLSSQELALPDEFVEEYLREASQSWDIHNKEREEAVTIAKEFSQGNPVAFRTFFQYWQEYPTHPRIAREKGQKDFLHYLDYYVFSYWEESEQELAIKLAAFPKLTEGGISSVLGQNPAELVESLKGTSKNSGWRDAQLFLLSKCSYKWCNP